MAEVGRCAPPAVSSVNRKVSLSPGHCALVMSLWALGAAFAFAQEPDGGGAMDGASDAASVGGNIMDGQIRAGRALYESHQCWQCHGYEGQGSVAGVRVAPTLYPYEAFVQLVRHTNLMPAYSPYVLSDEQLRLIYAFVQSIPEPPPLEDIPELDFD